MEAEQSLSEGLGFSAFESDFTILLREMGN